MKKDKIATLQLELAEQKRKSWELRAQLASTIGAAFDNVPKAADFHGSCVIVSIVGLGGNDVISPVAIRDGLSQKTIAALQEDLRRSFELATMVSPAMARGTTMTTQIDWYERRAELRPGMVFTDYEGDLVKLDRHVPGDATKWYVASWTGRGWCYDDCTIEPGDIVAVAADPAATA